MRGMSAFSTNSELMIRNAKQHGRKSVKWKAWRVGIRPQFARARLIVECYTDSEGWTVDRMVAAIAR